MIKLLALGIFAMFTSAAFASQSGTSHGSTKSEAAATSLTCTPGYKTCTQGCLAVPPPGKLECFNECKANFCH